MAEEESTGLLQFPCKSCGAKLTFDPNVALLDCQYCGYSEEIPQSADEVVERGFEDYKADATGWGTELKSWLCDQCGSRTEVEPHVTATSCAFCGSDKVQPQADSPRLHKPESVLPFVVTKEQTLEVFRRWVSKLWFRPSALKKQARPDRLRGVYLPFWTYDSMTSSFWTAQRGDHYYEEDSEGNRERKTRWRSVSGDHSAFFDDVLVAGSSSVEAKLLQAVEPFDTNDLVPYQPAYLSGMVAEDYRTDMLECWPIGKGRMDVRINAAVVSMIGGDTHRRLDIQTTYLNRTYKLCLLPVWLATYRYNNTAYTYIVNGQTGAVAGTAPWSWVKIASFVLSIVGIIGGIIWSQQ
jgi:DNA-directed RNA polymerase subunit RPC12/RpoP